MHLNESMFSDEEREALEAIRRREGLENMDQAFEWLAKFALRNGVKRITGKGRALYVIEGKTKPCE
ncbi:hypothetical protein [uncultured Herbaspirillum sp.]|uniref:hypothetical protein n=1 Tax=uncultured Herbaspirillum sp. TaxID=160236 RepID=UPI000551776C|nr:hypothetical protein [uncultured Herbaspirillum sp.]